MIIAGAYATVTTSPGASSERLGYEMSWLLSGLFLALIAGVVVQLTLPEGKGRFMLATSLVYLVVGIKNVSDDMQFKRDNQNMVANISKMLDGETTDFDSDGPYRAFSDYLQESNATAQGEWNLIGSAFELALAAFDFYSFPKVSNCATPELNWNEVINVITEAKGSLSALHEAIPSKIAALSLPQKMKNEMLRGIKDEGGATFALNDSLLTNYIEYARLQIDGCAFLLNGDVEVVDDQPIATSENAKSKLTIMLNAFDRNDREEKDLIKKIATIEKKLRGSIEKYQ